MIVFRFVLLAWVLRDYLDMRPIAQFVAPNSVKKIRVGDQHWEDLVSTKSDALYAALYLLVNHSCTIDDAFVKLECACICLRHRQRSLIGPGPVQHELVHALDVCIAIDFFNLFGKEHESLSAKG